MASSSSWTAERRAKHSAAIRRWAPWTRSTGPRTPAGKEISKMNAFKHGQYCREAIKFRRALTRYGAYLKFLFRKQDELLHFQRNELLKERKNLKVRNIKNSLAKRDKWGIKTKIPIL